MERRKNADENAITSIILSEDNIYVQQNEKENKRPSITVNTVEGIKAESKLLQKNVSLTEKNVSSLSPEDFPPTMESINQLDSEITETEVDGTKTSIENVAQGEQKENSSETAAAKISEETTGDKESNTSEVSKTDKGQKNEDDVSSKSSKLASSSFTVLDDNSFGKESGVSNSSDITGDSKTEKFKTNKSFKEGGVQKNEKSTKIVHSKSTTIRKYEKTTKTALKKDCRGQSDEKSVSNSEQGNEKVTKMYKTNKMNDEKSEKTKANDNTEEFTEGTRQDLKVDTIHEADNLTETPQDTDNIVASEEIAINESTVTFTEAPTQSKKPIEEGDSNTDASEIKASKETTPAEVTDKDDNEKNETETELKKSEEISEEKKEKPSEEWNSPSFIEPASLKFENPVGVHEEIVIAEVYESEPSLNLAEEQKSEISEDHSYQLNATNISSEQKEDSLKPTIEENPNRISVALDEENAEPLNEESKEVKTNDDTEEKILKEPEMKNAISATDIEKFIENEKIQSSVVQVTNTEEKKALENTDGVSELISLGIII